MTKTLRVLTMLALLAGGSSWLAKNESGSMVSEVRFLECARSAGCINHHTMVSLAHDFDNIMPWLSSVGAAAAAGDFDADGDADLYVTNSGRNDSNRLFRNRGDATFEDVTAEAGVGCGNPEGGSMHAVWGDVDNDGDLDLYVVKWAETNTLFRNEGGPSVRFVDITQQAGVGYWGYANGATFLDYDRDGWLDILVGNYFAESIRDPQTGQMVRSDLWKPVSTKVMHETFTHADNGGRNVLYRNRGDGSFEDVTQSAGLGYTGWTLAVGAGDLNDDGWADLYLANDFGPDELYLSTGATENPPRFRLIVDPQGHPGVGNDWWKGMNVDLGDVNNDGYLDIYVTNVFARRYKTDEGNMLWLNCVDPHGPGGRGFRNIGEESETFDGGWGWGGKFADFNNDGLLDIFTVNGFVTGDAHATYWFHLQEMVTQTKNQTVDARDWPMMGSRDLSGRERSRLFIQRPESESPRSHAGHERRQSVHAAASDNAWDRARAPRFTEGAESAGITDLYNGRGIALADYNLDGALDIYVANQGAPSSFYVNQRGKSGDETQHAFLRLTLVGRPEAGLKRGDRTLASTRCAVGARVTVHTRTGIQMREVQGGTGFAGQSEYALHFGIPDPSMVERIVVRWPSGREEEIQADQARAMVNHPRRLEEGEIGVTVP